LTKTCYDTYLYYSNRISLYLGGSTISIVSHEPTMQNNNRDTVDSLSQPAQQNWSTVWPSLPDNMTHKGSCTNTLWNTFITALTKQYQVIDKAHLRGTLSMEDQRNINKTLTVLAHSSKYTRPKNIRDFRSINKLQSNPECNELQICMKHLLSSPPLDI
jgi:hypothetical protein